MVPSVSARPNLAGPREEASERPRHRLTRGTHPPKADPLAGPEARPPASPLYVARGPVRIRSSRQRDHLRVGECFSGLGIPRHRARVTPDDNFPRPLCLTLKYGPDKYLATRRSTRRSRGTVLVGFGVRCAGDASGLRV